MEKSVVISPCGDYRYRLSRKWEEGPRAVFVMLNPSTADAEIDDPTIRRCMNYAKSWGRGGIDVVNLFAYRATSPTDLKTADDPVGPLNRQHVAEAVFEGFDVVCAWGVHGTLNGQDREVWNWIIAAGAFQPYALGITKDGRPRHPLYLRKDAELVPFKPSQ